MKINNQNRVRLLRKSIEETIAVLSSKFVFADDDSGSEIKSSVKTKKNAFLRAKYLLGQLQNVETAEARDASSEWYKNTIESMISAAEEATDALSEVMKLKVNLEEKSSAINSAVDAKQEAYDYMSEMYSGVVELSSVLRSIEEGEGVKLLNTNDFKSGYAEDHAYYGFYKEKKRKYQPEYNEKLDAVVISYDGTIGDIIECYGLRIALPKPPPKSSFKNYRKKDEDQYWERPELPDGLTRETASMYDDVIEEEFRRRDEGYWFLNNGEYEYITGAHYMLLTYFKADAEQGKYFHFRKAHRDLFYFLEASWVDKRSLGVMLGKTRRTGATHVADAFSLTKAISTRDAMFGLTSKKNIDAKRAFQKQSLMFRDMPFFFKPINTGEGLANSLVFQKPSQRATKNTHGKDVVHDDLNTIMDYEATSEDSYDGSALRFYIADEFSKHPESEDIISHFDKVKRTLLSGGIVRGKMFILSTVENVTGEKYDSDSAKNGDKFKHLFEQSKLHLRDKVTGQTPSRLYAIFISALDNFGGFIDKYGNCISHTPKEPIEGVNGEKIVIGVKEHLEADWAKYKNDPSRLNDEKRKDPITEEDMFRIASDMSLFDTVKIQDNIEHNTNFLLANGHPDYVVGNFSRDQDGLVQFKESSNGRFKIAWLPDKTMRNNVKMEMGLKSPANKGVGLFGIDPYKFSETGDGKGSKGAIVGYLMDHPIDGIPKHKFFLVYLAKPQTVEIFIDDAIMCMEYYGMPALIENNVPRILEDMLRLGYTKYAMRRPDKTKLSFDENRMGGIPSTDVNLILEEAIELEKYISNHIGYADSDEWREFGEIGDCPFNELLDDWLTFNIKKRTKYDATVASCLAIYGARKFHLSNLRESKPKIKASTFYNFVAN